MLLLIIFSVFIASTTSVKVPQCNQMQFNLNVSQETGTVVHTLSFIVDVAKTKPLHNNVTLSNFKRWSYNESYIEVDWIDFFAESLDYGFHCELNATSCEISDMRDGLVSLLVSVQNGPFEIDEEWFMNFWFIEGTMYNSKYGQMFDPVTDPCFHEIIDWGVILFTTDYCCTNFFEVDIPDPSTLTETCVEFYSNTNFTAPNGTTLANVGILYGILDQSIDASANKFTGPPGALYYLSPNLDEWVKPCEDNSVEYPCVVSQLLNDTNKDHTYNFNINVWDEILSYDWDAIAAQLIKRKGVWMKNVEQPTPYTRNDPCWTRTVDSNNDTTSVTSFCCTRWAPISTGTCAEYGTKTTVNSNTDVIDVLNTRYTFNQNNSMTVQIYNYTTSSNNIQQNVQVESYSSSGQAQYCAANSTTGNTCLFKEFSNDNYTLIMRTSDASDGWNMITISIDGQQIISPSINGQNPCSTETHNYNGLQQNTTATTEICCIATVGGPWPGST